MAVLSTAARKKLPSKSFALPGKGEGPKGKGAGAYPIEDKSHARNALARVSQHGSSAQKAKVRAKVHAKYPDIGEDRSERAKGGRAKRGTTVNIVIGTPGGMSHGAGAPGAGLPPNLAIKPPPAAPMPMPTPGAPPAAMPMPMPVPVGMPGAGMAGGAAPPLPPRARGGRAPRVRGEPEAGSGSGLGRLQKAAEYGRRSHEGEGLRK